MRIEADVLIVGAGIVGCAVAHEIAARGVSVEVVDSRAVGQGATQASAGMLAPYIEAHEGGALFDLTVRSLDLYDHWIERVRADSGAHVEYRRSGSLEVAMDHAAAARLEARASRPGVGEQQVWLDGTAARATEPAIAQDALGALSVPTHGYVAATMLTDALAAAASARGARIHEGVRITRLDPRGHAVEILADSGTSWRAQRVVIAAGSWTGLVQGVDDAAAKDVRPIRGQLVRVAWRGRPLTQVIWGPGCYLVPWADGTVLIGATMEDVGFEELNTVAGVRSLLDAATALLPRMADATFLGARAGLRPSTPDGLPFIGPSDSSDRIVYATGHYRNGILLAPLTAQLVADLVVDARADPVLATLGPARCRRPSAALND